MVMANMVIKDTAIKVYRKKANILQTVVPYFHPRFQKMLSENGSRRQQNSRSEVERLMINTAVAFRTLNVEILFFLNL
jgi:hypothetical protein